MKTFRTLQEALDAGYTKPNRKTDQDTSGPGSFGYQFTAPDGRTTEAVWLSEDTNKIGQPGCFVVLFPPAV